MTATEDVGERENARLAALKRLDAVHPDVDEVLQRLVDDAREAFTTDLCMVNLILADVQYFRAWSGELPEDLAKARQDPRGRSMCQYVVENEAPLVVNDFLTTRGFEEQHFRVNYGLRFYAGVPLFTADGYAVGSLCLLNAEPVEFGEGDLVLLEAFGRAVVGRLETLGSLGRERKLREEEARRGRELERLGHQKDQILNAAAEGIFGLDHKGKVEFVNPAAAIMVGYEPVELVGRSMHDLVHHTRIDGSSYPQEECPIYAALRDGEPRRSDEEIFWRKDGASFPVEYASNPVLEGGKVVGVVVTFSDVTGRRGAEEALKKSEKRFRSLVQNASDLITVLGADGTVIYESPAVERMLGYAPEDLVGRNTFDLIHPDDAPRVLRAFARLSEEAGANPYVEYRFRHGDGSWRHLESSGANLLDEPSVGGIVVNSRDVTERKELEEKLLHQALHDLLTGLPNRALFMDRLTHALDRAGRDKACVAVLFLDLDDFKVVNDSLGHDAGDKLLVAAAGRLKNCLRPGDTLARPGGDEFVVLLEDIRGKGDATGVAGRLLDSLRGSFPLGAQEVFVSASVGVALGGASEDRLEGHPGDPPDVLLRRADMAMYEAKRKGKARHEVFELHMDVPALGRLKMGADLRRAVERGEFVVHYQPEVSLSTGRVVGFEALVRWEHPEHGLVPPDRFIPIAEETGLVVPMGRWVLGEACRQAKEWRERCPYAPPLAMSVNLSARQFEHPSLARDVARVLQETNTEPGSLVLEITESVVMEDARSTIRTFEELKAIGVKLAIDDFGTGYSSLSYLRRFPVDYLKVDRSFVDGLGEDPGDMVLVSGIVDLAHALGLHVVAEGVETEGQLGLLRKMGCDLAQGYHFADPLPDQEAWTLLSTARHER